MTEPFKYEKIRACLRNDKKRDNFTKLQKFCKKNGYLFCDKEFPPEFSSLVAEVNVKNYDGSFDNVAWMRASDFYKTNKYTVFESISPTDILQGGLGDCYFLCALASLAENSSLISRLFDTDEPNPNGIISVWLNISGTWNNYVLDEYLPVNKKKDGFVQDLAFSSTIQRELWVVFLEKAYAKAYGDYYSIIGGDPVHALRDLSGAPYEHIRDFSNQVQVWELIQKYNTRNYIFSCWMKSTETTEEKTSNGLVCGHAYSLLNFAIIKNSAGVTINLLQLRNPWGNFEWNGEYSDKSPLWTPQQRIDFQIDQAKDDGIFWIPFDKFIESYEGIGVLKIEPNYIFHSGKMVKKCHSENFKMLKIKVTEATHIFISLDQIDTKIIDDKDYTYSYFRITIGKLIPDVGVKYIFSTCSPDRNIFAELNLEKGEYIVLIDCYWLSELADSFCITTYSKYAVDIIKCNEPQASAAVVEYLIWLSYAIDNKATFDVGTSNTITVNKEKVKVNNFKKKLTDSLLTVHVAQNESKSQIITQTTKIVKIIGYDVFARSFANQEISSIIDKEGFAIFLLKMDPKFESFSVSQQVKSITGAPSKDYIDFSVIRKLYDLQSNI